MALGLGRFRQRLAVMGQKRLVGGDHILAGRYRGLGRGLRRPFGAAYHLDKDIHIGTARECHGILFPGIVRQVDGTVPGARPRGNRSDHDGPSGTLFQKRRMGLHDADDAGADSAQPCDAKSQRVGHAASSLSRRAGVSRWRAAMQRMCGTRAGLGLRPLLSGGGHKRRALRDEPFDEAGR
jgi:hypothetical protein